MNTKYGLRGSISPGERFKAAEEPFVFDGFEIEIKDGAIAIGFNDSADAGRARDVVRQHLAWFSLRHGIRYTADLNQSWELKSDNTEALSASVHSYLRAADDIQVTTATIQGKARIVTDEFDSARVASYSALVAKSQRSPVVAKAMEYFSDEVVDDDRPLYGVYKALEELCYAVGGQENLAKLVNQPKSYVNDVMKTAQATRHARTQAPQVLTNQECRERTRILIEAFAKSI